MKKAITLLSGGLDSMVSTFIALKKHEVILALTFDYGQRAAGNEILAARKICKAWNIKLKIIKLPWLEKNTNTALVNHRFNVPHLTNYKLGNLKNQQRSARAVWVPNRNAIFINIAAAFAETYGADLIITGFNREEAVTFPDNSPKFVKTINKTLKYSTLKHPVVVSCTQKMSKLDMVRYAMQYRLPLHYCWSCYMGGKNPCGLCESCVRYDRAYEKAISR